MLQCSDEYLHIRKVINYNVLDAVKLYRFCVNFILIIRVRIKKYDIFKMLGVDKSHATNYSVGGREILPNETVIYINIDRSVTFYPNIFSTTDHENKAWANSFSTGSRIWSLCYSRIARLRPFGLGFC